MSGCSRLGGIEEKRGNVVKTRLKTKFIQLLSWMETDIVKPKSYWKMVE